MIKLTNLLRLNIAADVLKVLDLSHNDLSGMIPPDLGGLMRASVYLRNNPNM